MFYHILDSFVFLKVIFSVLVLVQLESFTLDDLYTLNCVSSRGSFRGPCYNYYIISKHEIQNYSHYHEIQCDENS